jgi:hypothetical protein
MSRVLGRNRWPVVPEVQDPDKLNETLECIISFLYHLDPIVVEFR